VAQPAVRGLPLTLEALLADLKVSFPRILEGNLAGIYLHGSLTQGAFDPARSDVDGIVVTRRALTTRQFHAIGAWLRGSAGTNPWTRRLQLTFLIQSSVLTMKAAACLYQFGRLRRGRSDGNPIIWMNVLDAGVTLAGPPADSFLPPITAAMLDEALERELAYLEEEITARARSRWRRVPSYRVYAVLTVCRILQSAETRRIHSKPAAARWAMPRLPSSHRALVRRALRAHLGAKQRILPLAEIRGFLAFAKAKLLRRAPSQ